MATIYGTAGNDNLIGEASDDALFGLTGNDTLDGDAGDDYLNGGTGNDTLDGGSGFDAADYTNAATGISVNLTTGTASGGYGNDVLFNIEAVYGSSFNDTLIGGVGNDTMTGEAGNDTMTGDAGNDILDGGTGNDTLNGGTGFDAAGYINAVAGVNVNLATGTVSGAEGNDVLFNIEAIYGSNFNDTLTGGADNDTLTGGAGNDTLTGGAGDDILDGEAGNDTLVGGAGSDALTGGAGGDIFVFNSLTQGIDTIADFTNSQGDKIQVSASGFGIGQNQFDKFTFDSSTGELFFEETQFASIQPGASFVPSRDINIVVTPAPGQDPGNIGTALVESSAVFSQSQQVSTSDSNDFYRFTVNQSGVFTANLTGLTGDADVQLLQDVNNNGVIDQGEVRAWQWERGVANESIRSFLEPGDYFLAVNNYNNQTANYTVATNFTAQESDELDFSISFNLGKGLDGLSTSASDAITEAAEIWEQAISYSTFNGVHNLEINITGEFSNEGFLATASPSRFLLDANDRLIPTSGNTIINTRFLDRYNNNPDYLRNVITHELGHVLGIGTVWQLNGLIDPYTATYNANTYAGSAFGELLDTFTPIDIPLTTGLGAGSDLGHWSEVIFDSELMTEEAEALGTLTPLSQMTIASLRDIGWNVNYGAAQPYDLPTLSDFLVESSSPSSSPQS